MPPENQDQDPNSPPTPNPESAPTPPTRDTPAPQPQENSETPSFTAPSQPIVSDAPPPVAGGRKRGFGKRSLLTIAAAVIVVFAAIGVAAYTVYNQPDRVVRDAFRSVLNAESFTFSGTISLEPVSAERGAGGTFTADFTGQRNSDASQVDFELGVNFAPFNIDLNGSAIATSDGDLYLKVNDTREVLTSALGTEILTADEFEAFARKVDNKWISFAASEAEGQGVARQNNLSCVQGALSQLVGNDEEQNELFRLYEENRFVTVENELGTENIGGRSSIGYELGFNEDEAESFGSAAENLPVVQRLAECNGYTTGQENTGVTGGRQGAAPEVTFNLWADRWSHELTRFEITMDDAKTGKLQVSIDTNLGQPAEITVPTEDITPIDEIDDDLQGLFFYFMLSGLSEDSLNFDPLSTT